VADEMAERDLRRVERAAVKVAEARQELRVAIELARASGETLQAIGDRAGLTATRIKQILDGK
jgi:hypothetical protein